MEKYYVGSIGYAQVGQTDYEEKEKFESAFIISTINEMKFSRKIIIKREKTLYDGQFPMTNIIMLFPDTMNNNEIQCAIDRVDAVDWDGMEDLVASMHRAKKNVEEVNEITQEASELSLEEVAINGGYNDVGDMIESQSFKSVVATTCPLSCEVEPDGECSHGYESVLLKYGVI